MSCTQHWCGTYRFFRAVGESFGFLNKMLDQIYTWPSFYISRVKVKARMALFHTWSELCLLAFALRIDPIWVVLWFRWTAHSQFDTRNQNNNSIPPVDRAFASPPKPFAGFRFRRLIANPQTKNNANFGYCVTLTARPMVLTVPQGMGAAPE